MEQELIQAAVNTFCAVPEVYQQVFQQMGADFPDELVQAIKTKPEDAVQMVQNDKELLKGIVAVYQQYGDQINQAAQQAKQQTGMFAKGGKLEHLLNKFQPGGLVSEPIRGNWDDYHTIIKAPGDTLRFKQYFSGPHTMQTFPNGNVRYSESGRSGISYYWKPGSKPNIFQKIWYGNKVAPAETVENWNQLIYNHRNDKNVKDTSR